MSESFDVVCVGGGILGLATAYELVQRSHTVAVLDRGPVGREASWAGAGIVPPADFETAQSPFEKLRGFSFRAYPEFAERLESETGIDVGFVRTGGIELALADEELAELRAASDLWTQRGIAHQEIDTAGLDDLEPKIARTALAAFHLPDVCQVRNPRLLKALECACTAAGVQLRPGREVTSFNCSGDELQSIHLVGDENISCANVVVTAGAWSARLLAMLGCTIPVFPVQGQIVAMATAGDIVRHVVLTGKRYLVPRPDGLVLIGSTEEDVGFDKQITDAGAGGLRQFACRLYPDLETLPIAAAWAGLRPGSALNAPIIGRAPGWSNLWVATGHFRQGLQTAPGTARLLADFVTGSDTFVEPDAFAPGSDHGPDHDVFQS